MLCFEEGRFIGPTIGRVGVAGMAGKLVYRGRERVERKAERTEVENNPKKLSKTMTTLI